MFFDERQTENFTGEIGNNCRDLNLAACVFRPRVYPRSLSSDMLTVHRIDIFRKHYTSDWMHCALLWSKRN